MNHLIAKTSGRKSDYYKVISDKQIFELPDDLANPKVYDSDYKLEDDEWFHIPTFSTSKYCIPILQKEFISAEYSQISATDLKKNKIFVRLPIQEIFLSKNIIWSVNL